MKKNLIKRMIFPLGLTFALVLGGCGNNEASTLEDFKAPSPEAVFSRGAADTANQEAASELFEDVADAALESTTQEQVEEEMEIPEGMTTRQKVAQMLMVTFKTWNDGSGSGDVNVTELNDEIRDSIKRNQFGGVILFSQNSQNARQLKSLTDDMQSANLEGGALARLFISIDQEGGYITRLVTGTQMPGNMALAATRDPQNAGKSAAVMAKELTACGINVDFGPDVDVNDNPDNPIIGVRSFSDDPNIVSEYGNAFIDGLHSEGIMSAVKHFPGHGNTQSDSHTGLPVVDKSMEELLECELIPFKGIAKNSDFVMTAHISYPQITGSAGETYTSMETGEEIVLPATLSKTIITDILRDEIGFEGVVVTDALDMGAVARHVDKLDSARFAINAGVDMLLMPVNALDAESLAALDQYIDDVTALVEAGDISMQQVDDSVKRILNLKKKYGLLAEDEPKEVPDVSIVGSKEHHDIEWELAKKAVTLLKNDDCLPLGDGKNVLIACPSEARILSAEFALQKLKDEGIITDETKTKIISYGNLGEADAKTALGSADTVIAITAFSGGDDINLAFLNPLFEESRKAGAKFIFLSGLLPYDVTFFPEADALVACYNPRGMTELPGDYEPPTPQYGPNLPAAIYEIFGGSSPEGKLPVKISSDKINFERGTGLSY